MVGKCVETENIDKPVFIVDEESQKDGCCKEKKN